jgi:predicted nucleic acid-binding protein
LLQLTGDRVLVPRPVADEVPRRGEHDATARAIRETPWLEIVEPPAIPAAIQAWGLGLGESAVLACACAVPEGLAILDDLAARRCAAALRIPVRGTLGLVLLAKRRGTIALARPIISELRQAGMFLSARVADAALALVGE